MAMNFRSNGINSINMGWYNMAAVNNFKLAQSFVKRADAAVSSIRPVNKVSKNNVSALSKDSSEFLKRYQEQLSRLQQAARDLSSSNVNSAANQMAVSASDPKVLDVQSKGTPTSPAAYQVNVQQTATAQSNESSRVWGSAAPSSGGSFTLSTSGGTAELHIDPSAASTNRELYQAIADEINRLDLGVTAKAQESGGKVSISVSSAETGKENSFSISGELAEKMGLNQVKQNAQDAVYTVKDEKNPKGQPQEFTSASNKVSIGDEQIEAVLKEKGSSQVKIGDDVKGMADKLDNLVDTFNKTVKFLDSNAERGTGVLNQLRRMAQLPTGEKAMNTVGISANKDGTLSFDRDVFAKAMDSSPRLTKEIVSGSYGVAERIGQDAKAGMNTSSAKLVDYDSALKSTQNYINQMNRLNMLDQWSYSPMGTYSKASTYNMFQYFTSGALMSMYI